MSKTFTVFDNMKFPDYEFVEYPKHVYPSGPDKPYVVVNSAEEEVEALKTGTVVREADETRRLQKVCEIKGVQFDGRWKVDRLTKAIRDAGHDPDLNPFE